MAFRHWKYILHICYILSCFLQCDNKSEITKLISELFMLKAKFKGVLTGCNVTMVTLHIKGMIAT